MYNLYEQISFSLEELLRLTTLLHQEEEYYEERIEEVLTILNRMMPWIKQTGNSLESTYKMLTDKISLFLGSPKEKKLFQEMVASFLVCHSQIQEL